jgi:hypothetical protein
MSAFTNVAFINQDLPEVKKFFSSKSEPAYLYQIKDNWTALFLNEEYENTNILIDFSISSSCYIIEFISSEETSLYYSLYQNGKQLDSFAVNFDDQTKELYKPISLIRLKELSVIENETLLKRVQLLFSRSDSDDLFDSSQLFLELIGFNSVYGLSFSDLELYSEKQLNEVRFIPIK